MDERYDQVIGERYRILKRLGMGGMASVYLARDIRLDRDVALKFIRPDAIEAGASQQYLKRFERETRTLAKLSHQNIVKIMDSGEQNGSPYLVMEYIAGGTLSEKVKTRIPYQEAARLLLPIANALAYAHQMGVIHRDIKPANILISPSGNPMLSDFGIAKILSGENTALTNTGVGVGTPEYMSPEQGLGEKVDHRVDIYALGVVLYELIIGHKPYLADTPMAVMIKHINSPLPRPKDFLPDLPDEVERIIFKALAKKAENRYQSMAEFEQDLRKIALGGLPIHDDKPTVAASSVFRDTSQLRAVSQPNAPKRMPQQTNRPKEKKFPVWIGCVGAAGIFLVILCVGISVFTYLNGSIPEPITVTQFQKGTRTPMMTEVVHRPTYTPAIISAAPLPEEQSSFLSPLKFTYREGNQGIEIFYSNEVVESLSGETFLEGATDGFSMETISPEHILISFSGYIITQSLQTPQIYIFPVEKYKRVDSNIEEEVLLLISILETKPVETDEMPFLPRWNAHQMMQTNIQYITFKNGRGVRYLTMYGQDVVPANNASLFYTFQGLSDDQKTYIAAIYPVNHSELPVDYEAGLLAPDWKEYADNYQTYITVQEEKLSSYPDFGFVPGLQYLDDMMKSITLTK